jgi:hypothetical protein
MVKLASSQPEKQSNAIHDFLKIFQDHLESHLGPPAHIQIFSLANIETWLQFLQYNGKIFHTGNQNVLGVNIFGCNLIV